MTKRGTQGRGTRGGKHAPKRLAAIERMEQAWELRRLGLSFREVAQETGMSKSQAHRVIAELAADASQTLGARVAECVALDLDTLAKMQRSKQPAADAGDDDAINTVLRILEARRKLLGIGSDRGPAVAVQINNEPAPAAPDLDDFLERVRDVMPQVIEIALANPGSNYDEPARDWPVPTTTNGESRS